MYGSFVITTSDGSRFYALWRGSPSLLFIAISIFPLVAFTRNLFSLLINEHSSTLSPILQSLCEFPILACPSLRYNIRLSSGSLPLNFNEIGLVDDHDINTVAVRVLSPQMLVDAWEALILENQVLVLCSNPAIVPYCCEFLRRLILPLILINTFVPFLPEELLSTIEAPFPYLVGAQSDEVYNNRIDLSNTFVVDIDSQCVRPPRTYTEDCSAPINMKNKAIQEINALCYQPLAQWICRATESNLDGKNSNINNNNDINNNNNNNNNNTTNHKSILIQPYSPDSMKICADGIIKCFIQMNLSLFAARHCDVRAFYRRCERPLACEGSKSREPFHLPKYKGPDGRISSMGFSYRNGVACGCMQLLNERKDIDVLQFLPCWVEMDSVVFSVYEYADELPLIFFLKKDIVSVSPSPAEPEGHVFDIQIGSQISYRFAATDPDSRRVWIKEIEKASSQRLLNQLPSLSPTTPTSLSTSTLTQSQLQSQSQSFSPAPNTPTTPHSPYPLYQQYSHLSIQSELELNHENDENGGGSSHTDFDDESNVLSRFRSKVVQTQMVSFFKTRSEFPEYGNMLGEQDLTHEDITIGIPYTTPQEDILNSQRINSQDGAESSCGEEHDNNNGNNGNGNGNNNGNGNGHNSVKYKLISDTDTTICSEVVIHNIKNIWGLYISGELVSNKGPYDVSYRGNRDRSENKRKGVSIRKSNLNTESASWLIQSPVSQAASLTFLSKTPREYTNLSLLHKAAIDADSNDQKSSKESSGWSILRTFMSSNEGDTSVKRNEAREELNKAIKEELMLKCAAGELLQRVSATHRQCEADLRKLIVHMKMKSIADIVDVNSLLRNDNLPPAVVVVDIERVAALAQTDMSAESRKRLRELVQSKHHTWQSCIKSWGEVIGSLNTPVSPTDKSPRLRRKSMQNLLFSAHLQQVTSSLDTVEEFSNMIPSLSFSGQHPNHNDEEDVTITRQSVMEYMESNGTFFKSHTKKLYSSPETDSIRRHIKIEIESQLIKSSESSAEVYEKVLIPVLHALNGYVCGRISGQERTAVSAYATGALGDQVRIMRCLLHIFLSFIKDRDSNSDSSVVVRTQVSTDITDGGTLNDYLHSLSYSDGESRYILNSQQIGEFLQWAAGIGDIIGLQAVRFVTELIHRCLAKRMAQRSLEQTEKLPVQSFGDNVLNEFKREVTHGIYSRRRVSLSNMQPSFIWVDVSGDKKSDVLNEVVNCTMSAAKPCELSIQLLNSLREMLRTVSEAGDGTEERIPASRQVAGSHHLILNDHLRETLCASSAFRSFEIQTSQLQMVDLLSLDDQSRIVFFSNIFNVIVVHAIILKGYTGTGFYDKCNFMRMAKYNLSGQIFNLLEIEHTILRAQTSSPNSIVGPFIHVSERSPKSVFALKKPIPHISFTLFFACYSSPPLTTLWDPSSVHQELRRAASTYLLTHARVDSATKTLLLPEIFKWYWRDFGESKKAVLTTVLHLLGRDSWLTQEILKHIDQNKPKIAHIPFDWRFVLII